MPDISPQVQCMTARYRSEGKLDVTSSPRGHLQSQYVSRFAPLLEPPSAYLDTDHA